MSNITGAILAGGQSSRFGNTNKALALLDYKPLIQHVIDRLAPQVSDLILSGEPYDDHQLSIPTPSKWVADMTQGHGPLIAVLSCLNQLQEQNREQDRKQNNEWLLTSACDTPFLPLDLAEKLMRAAVTEKMPIAVAHDGTRLQPATMLWHRDLFPILKAETETGIRGFHQFLDTQPHAVFTWPVGTNHFININTQLDLENAEALLPTS